MGAVKDLELMAEEELGIWFDPNTGEFQDCTGELIDEENLNKMLLEEFGDCKTPEEIRDVVREAGWEITEHYGIAMPEAN